MTVFIWLAALIFFVTVEAMTVTLVSVWFAVGALAACIAAFCQFSLSVQIVVFVAVSAVMLACLRPFSKKVLRPGITATNVDSIVGAEGIVTAEIDNITAAGQVKLSGMVWTARSTTGEPIPTGTHIRVDRIEGVKVYVTPVHSLV